jgi:hypothetical protein
MKRAIAYLSSALLSVSVSALASSGCNLYFGGDDDDDCLWGGERPPEGEAAVRLRNPETGQCEAWGGGGWPCEDPCVPCAQPAAEKSDRAIAWPSWGTCDGYCETLDEATCLVTSGCRGAYVDDCGGFDCRQIDSRWFAGCWATDTTGPIQGGGCAGLDAWECSRHDDCKAIHAGNGCYVGAEDGAALMDCDPLGWFLACEDEGIGCYSDYECPAGMRCNAWEICLPPPGCGGAGDDPGTGQPYYDCDAACYGTCVPTDPTDPGSCWGPIYCDALTPDCPMGTTPGIKDGCWTGLCIPLDECEPTVVECSMVTSEDECLARPDCTTYYEGYNCVCDSSGACYCADWKFSYCA